MSDPRDRLSTILSAVTATKDDDVTPAVIQVIYQGGPETYRYLFDDAGLDAVIVVGRHTEEESGAGKRIQDIPLRYSATVPVYVSAVDKTDITATLLLNKIRLSIQAQVEANAQTVDYTWILQRDDSQNQRMGSYDPLWQDRYTVIQRPMVSS